MKQGSGIAAEAHRELARSLLRFKAVTRDMEVAGATTATWTSHRFDARFFDTAFFEN